MPPMPEEARVDDRPEQERAPILLLLLLVGTCVVVFVRTAWISEDAYITFRTVDNLFHGYGLRWNVAERVQTFTHPLWMLVVTLFALFTREFFFTVSLLSIAISTAAVWILAARIGRNLSMGVIAILVLVLSRAFVDYSTSGLENPLTHLLLALELWLYFKLCEGGEGPGRREALTLALVAGLGILNRADTALLFVPPVIHVGFMLRAWRPRLLLAGVCCAPMALWMLFSLFYYGFPLPNTAYAKLQTGVPTSELVEQGLYYLLNSLSWDPLTLLVVGGVGLHALTGVRTREVHRAVVALGMLLYLYYVVRIGGDFMSGRFLSAPLLVATALLVRWRPLSMRDAALLSVPVLALGLSSGKIPLRSSEKHKNDQIDARGIADERGFYFPKSGLLLASRSRRLPRHENCETGHGVRRSGRPVAVEKNIGYMAWCAGPKVHFIDPHALSDPMLARLPVQTTKGGWRIGHFARDVPKGYEEALRGEGRIASPALREYRRHLARVTRGDLVGWQRFKEIWRFNTGGYDHLLGRYLLVSHFVLEPKDLKEPREIGTDWDAPGNRILGRFGMGIALGREGLPTGAFTLSVNGGRRYVVVYIRKDKVVHRQPVEVMEGVDPGMVWIHLWAPPAARTAGFDQIRVLPDGDPDEHSVGHFRALPSIERRGLSAMREPREPVALQDRMLLIKLGRRGHHGELEATVERTRRYRLALLQGNVELGAHFLRRFPKKKPGTYTHHVTVTPGVAQRGFDGLLVEALRGKAKKEPRAAGSVAGVRLR